MLKTKATGLIISDPIVFKFNCVQTKMFFDDQTLCLVCPNSQLHLSRSTALWRPVFSRLPIQLVCCRGAGSRPAGQPHPEGTAPQGSAGHQPGEASSLAATAVHQHPFPGRTLKRPSLSTSFECRSVLGGCLCHAVRTMSRCGFRREIRSTGG